jgi:hypothetical protein
LQTYFLRFDGVLVQGSDKDSANLACLLSNLPTDPLWAGHTRKNALSPVAGHRFHPQNYPPKIDAKLVEKDNSNSIKIGCTTLKILSKLKRTRSQITSDLYILNWKSSYDVTMFMCQSRSTIFPRIFIFVIFRPRDMQEYIFMFSIALEWIVNI